MDEKKKNAIIETLSPHSEDEYRFYVYALCDKENKKPFYIGKGERGRIWDHEEELKENLSENLTEKQIRIKALIENQNYERVIVKWGLTEHEAFMVESALINMIGFENLTNEVNGHMSPKEKISNIQTTKAMTLDDFYENCCKTPIEFSKIKEFDEKKVVFININSLFADIDKDKNYEKQLCDITRGCWRISNSNKIDYIISVYRNVIYGIYEVVDKRSVLETAGYPKYPVRVRKVEVDIFSQGEKLWDELNAEYQEKYKNYKNELDKKPGKIVNNKSEDYYRNEYEKIAQRYYFNCKNVGNDTPIFQGTEKIYTTEDLIGSIIRNQGKSIFVQNPLRYLRDC